MNKFKNILINHILKILLIFVSGIIGLFIALFGMLEETIDGLWGDGLYTVNKLVDVFLYITIIEIIILVLIYKKKCFYYVGLGILVVNLLVYILLKIGILA